jgi:hypothetical protein
MSMMRWTRNAAMDWKMRLLKLAGRAVAAMRLHQRVEDSVESMMLRVDRSPEATERLGGWRPDVVLATGTFRYEEPAVVAVARGLGIPVLGYITSWDNISIKNRMTLRYDGYIVWSDRMKEELLQFYPHAGKTPVYVVGAPQFDVFHRREWHMSRREFCAWVGLREDAPIVTHALGVANGVEEHWAALELAGRVARGELGDAQLIIRPHPYLAEMDLKPMFAHYGPRVILQQRSDPATPRGARSVSERDAMEWVNTFRHSDVVVHLSSTVAVDAALFGRPSVCMDFDPAPGRSRNGIVRDVNNAWTHYKPIAESGAMALASNMDEVVAAVQRYLRNPDLDADKRNWIVDYVCGYHDGRCGERMAEAVLQFARERCGTAQFAGVAE